MALSSSHIKRLATAGVLIAGLVTCLVIGGFAHYVLVGTATFIALWEFYGLFSLPLHARLGGMALYGLMLTATYFFGPMAGFIVALLSFWFVNIAYMFICGEELQPDVPSRYSTHLVMPAGLVYVGCSILTFLIMTPAEAALVIVLTAVSDSAAYYAGSYIGGPKIWPSISPKKTWAGSVGSVVATALVALAAGMILGEHFPGLESLHWSILPAIGAALAVAAQLGDFFESALKRTIGVKDASNLLPGHGGLLDRIDGMLLAAPTYVLLCYALPRVTAILG
ncbi:phosphatidate cytidylyltransferase [Oceanidesulfovibrio indonesiensis]|uniref:Phosphatidate cytidylyltransferase n=1 Tax=Oceanidesulfovibrio indonesiensis TaxID=54767 RepID=A0A7M3MDB0_9BACT|nr:phosphatidate cytidylyltransferase [Oceanidesulfovibrio indonesiensis]TVM16221.1 phosphatidate cytidylyltransferase [Oceanidesulfovibrio indonesiensis]